MKAFIVAGGRGTRLAPHTETLPKPLIPVAGKPVLEYLIELLRRHRITDITILINHLGHKITSHLGRGERWGAQLSYFEEQEPLGTAGGIRELKGNLTEDFLVLYGDVLLNMDMDRFLAAHRLHRANDPHCIGTIMTQPQDHPADSDLVGIGQGNRVAAFYSKPHPANFVYRNISNIAVYVFSPEICEYIPAAGASDFGKHVLPAVLGGDRHSLYAYHTPEYSKDTGTPERLLAAERDVEQGWYHMNMLGNARPAVFLPMDSVMDARTGQLQPGAADAIRVLNAHNWYTAVIVSEEREANSMNMETRLGELGVKLDAIGDEKEIIHELNIDTKRSHWIHDNLTQEVNDIVKKYRV